MATKTISLIPQTNTLSNTQSGTTVADKKYVPSLNTTWTDGSTITYVEGEFGASNTTATNYIHIIIDDLVSKYA